MNAKFQIGDTAYVCDDGVHWAPKTVAQVRMDREHGQLVSFDPQRTVIPCCWHYAYNLKTDAERHRPIDFW